MGGGRGGDEMAGYVVPTQLFQSFSSQARDLFFKVFKQHVGLFWVKD